jgi:hypothetical protein
MRSQSAYLPRQDLRPKYSATLPMAKCSRIAGMLRASSLLRAWELRCRGWVRTAIHRWILEITRGSM